jgi:Tfp pilus assembly protein PilO
MSLQNQDVINALKKYPLRFACGVIVLVVAVAMYLRSGGIAEMEQLLEQRTQEGTRQQANISNGLMLSDHLAATTQANQVIAVRAIEPRALADNLQYFYQLEASLGVKLIDLRQGPPSTALADRSYVTVPFTVALDGTYPQILQFLRVLESGELYLRFTQVTITPQRDGSRGSGRGSEPLLTLSLNLDVLGRP